MSANDDYRGLLEQQRFLEEIEQGTRFANREIIAERIPALTRDNILSFAVAVGRLRARYLETAFKLGVDESGEAPHTPQVEELKHRREMYEEARHAFDALRDAIEKGYIDVRELTNKKSE